MTRLSHPSTLWEFALWLYAQPGVSSLCIRIQDRYGVDVLRVLWLAWLDWRAYPPDTSVRTQAEHLCEQWQSQVVAPLRGVRRWLEAGALRDQVKALELEAERVHLEQLQTLVEPDAGPDRGGDYWRAGLRDYLSSRAMPEQERDESLRRLLPWREQPAPGI